MHVSLSYIYVTYFNSN